MILSGDHFQAVPAAFLADFGTLGVAAAQVTYQNFLSLRMYVRDFSWASVNAFAATRAHVRVNCDCAGILVYAQSLEWASFNTGIILALCA